MIREKPAPSLNLSLARIAGPREIRDRRLLRNENLMGNVIRNGFSLEFQWLARMRGLRPVFLDRNTRGLQPDMPQLDLIFSNQYKTWIMKLQGKVAIITGASMGIGEEIAKLFSREGARLILCARDLTRLKAAEQRIGAGENVISVACDVSKRNQVDAMVQAGLKKFERIDILVNNAGFGLNDAVAALDIAQARQLFDTNLFGAMECMQAVIPVMRQQGGGDIVNISSVAGHISMPYAGVYSASKHAMNAVSFAARMELKRYNINVLTVCPGYIATDFARNMIKGQNSQRNSGSVRYAATPDVVARATLRGMLKRKREIITPRFYSMPIKLNANFPGLVERAVQRTLRPTSQVLEGERKPG
jgi:short-subunit dehydrogenase